MTASALDNPYILHPLGPFQVSSRGGVVVAHLVKFGHVVVRFDTNKEPFLGFFLLLLFCGRRRACVISTSDKSDDWWILTWLCDTP